jgi:hypothetical protein
MRSKEVQELHDQIWEEIWEKQKITLQHTKERLQTHKQASYEALNYEQQQKKELEILPK